MNNENNGIVGINLLNDASGERSTNLGTILVSEADVESITLKDVRNLLKNQLESLPAKFCICSKEGWQINVTKEEDVKLSQVLADDKSVNIQTKYDHPKIGIKDTRGTVIGFVFESYTTNLHTLKQRIVDEVSKPQDLSETFQFLEGNQWPISTVQENHMTVTDILIGSCVNTSITQKHTHNTEFASPEQALKKHKGVKELSFRSSKDISRLSSTNSSPVKNSAKEILISYVSVEASRDALCLKEELAALGFSVYLDVHEIMSGVDWQDSLNFAVSGCEVFVPLVTQRYGETLWTNREVKLADVLGKYILPINFLGEWPPRCLAIQFATTQFIPWRSQTNNQNKMSTDTNLHWEREDIKDVAKRISERVQKININTTSSLVRRTTIVKSCPCVSEDNQLAITTDREGKPLIMICLHPDQQDFAKEISAMFAGEPFEVWCTTELDKEHLLYLDGLASSQEGESYCKVIQNNCTSPQFIHSVNTFQEKADDASIVLFVLSQSFSKSRTCQQQVFYCEHRKKVIPILYEEIQMPDWMTMLIGSSGLESRKDENFRSILLQRIKMLTDPSYKLKRQLTIQTRSPTKRKLSTASDETDSPIKTSLRKMETSPRNEMSPPVKRPSLSSMKTVLLNH